MEVTSRYEKISQRESACVLSEGHQMAIAVAAKTSGPIEVCGLCVGD